MTRVQDTAVMLKFSAHTLGELQEPLRALAQNGYAIVSNFLSPAVTTALLAECQGLYHQGKAHTAGIGQGSRHRVLPTVRNDQIVWLDSTDLTPAQTIYWQAMENLRQCLNRAYFLGLVDYECHYAYYPAVLLQKTSGCISGDKPAANKQRILYELRRDGGGRRSVASVCTR